jgi:hypothetical protein
VNNVVGSSATPTLSCFRRRLKDDPHWHPELAHRGRCSPIFILITNVDRAGIEQREQRREARRLRDLVVVTSSLALALAALPIWALLSRNDARRQRDNAEARRTEAEALRSS